MFLDDCHSLFCLLSINDRPAKYKNIYIKKIYNVV